MPVPQKHLLASARFYPGCPSDLTSYCPCCSHYTPSLCFFLFLESTSLVNRSFWSFISQLIIISSQRLWFSHPILTLFITIPWFILFITALSEKDLILYVLIVFSSLSLSLSYLTVKPIEPKPCLFSSLLHPTAWKIFWHTDRCSLSNELKDKFTFICNKKRPTAVLKEH